MSKLSSLKGGMNTRSTNQAWRDGYDRIFGAGNVAPSCVNCAKRRSCNPDGDRSTICSEWIED